MFSFIDFYINRDVYKEYISPSIIYLLDLSYQKNISEYDISGKEDSLAEILAIAAMQELKKDEMMNFYYIITDARFNDTCVKNLFNLFFKNEKEKTTTNIENMNLVFSELLNNCFFNFSYIFENDEHENYCGYINNDKKKLKILINYLSENKLYYYALANFRNITKDEVVSHYIKLVKNQKYIYEIIYEHRGNVSLCSKEYTVDYFNKKDKQKCQIIYEQIETMDQYLNVNKYEIFLKMIAIAFGLPSRSIIGVKKNMKKTKNEIIMLPDTPYYDKHPLIFNNPVIEFRECLSSLNEVTGTKMNEEEKEKIITRFKEIHENIFGDRP